jgi:hypothetical protein
MIIPLQLISEIPKTWSLTEKEAKKKKPILVPFLSKNNTHEQKFSFKNKKFLH